eukprot:TRINITY_DN3320_c2_g1_i16.p1 TRINITY_DN3320_c2_g1~~TRINITY_DN3320_c2_g1_i16.p1  ORF type:complete len:453 (-),score=90.36 TRINITY_DN3320_c2_g1_i16:643-2001(-)
MTNYPKIDQKRNSFTTISNDTSDNLILNKNNVISTGFSFSNDFFEEKEDVLEKKESFQHHNQNTEHFSTMINLLKTNPNDRTDEMVDVLIPVLTNLKYLQEISPLVLRNFAKFCILEVFERNDYIFYQGDISNCFYVVYSGKVNIIVKDIYGVDNIVKCCRTGDSFGEMGLVSQKVRAATVQSAQYTQLLKIAEKDYKKVMLASSWETFANRIKLFRCLAPLDALTSQNIQLLAELSHVRTFHAGQVLCYQGSVPLKTYFIVEGNVSVLKRIDLLEFQDIPIVKVSRDANGIDNTPVSRLFSSTKPNEDPEILGPIKKRQSVDKMILSPPRKTGDFFRKINTSNLANFPASERQMFKTFEIGSLIPGQYYGQHECFFRSSYLYSLVAMNTVICLEVSRADVCSIFSEDVIKSMDKLHEKFGLTGSSLFQWYSAVASWDTYKENVVVHNQYLK